MNLHLKTLNHEKFAYIGATAVIAAMAIFGVVSSYNANLDENTIPLIEKQGFTDVVIDHSFYLTACSKIYSVRNKFSGINPQGEKVSGHFCGKALLADDYVRVSPMK